MEYRTTVMHLPSGTQFLSEWESWTKEEVLTRCIALENLENMPNLTLVGKNSKWIFIPREVLRHSIVIVESRK